MPWVRFRRRQKCSVFPSSCLAPLVPPLATREMENRVGVSRGLVKVKVWIALVWREELMTVGSIVEGFTPHPWKMKVREPNCRIIIEEKR